MMKYKIVVIIGVGLGIGLVLINEFLLRDLNMFVVVLCCDSLELGVFNEKFEFCFIIEYVDFNNEVVMIEI